MERVCVIDIGTISVRLGVADVDAGTGALEWVERKTTICDLGEGVDRTRRLSEEAVKRVLACVDGYLADARAHGEMPVCCTATSAARDAENSAELTGALAVRGLEPQIIEGELEGKITYLGASTVVPGDAPKLVVDLGGGSCELAFGTDRLEWVTSVDVGARRITERYGLAEPAAATELLDINLRLVGLFDDVFFAHGGKLPRHTRVVCCGGTATSVSAWAQGLETYDRDKVHASVVTREKLDKFTYKLGAMTRDERAAQPGVQLRRAGVIVGGSVVLGALLASAGAHEAIVSESDGLAGLALACCLRKSPLDWVPATTRLR